METAIERLPEANLAAISIPGEHVYREASEALERGLNLFIFSSNVPLEQELKLKTRGREKGLLVMGPDCGTVIINGVIMGFGIVVVRGPIGIVAVAVTGIQQVTTLLHRIGGGNNPRHRDWQQRPLREDRRHNNDRGDKAPRRGRGNQDDIAFLKTTSSECREEDSGIREEERQEAHPS